MHQLELLLGDTADEFLQLFMTGRRLGLNSSLLFQQELDSFL